MKEKILLMLLPFWSPLIPPLGIACLKSYLHPRGYKVKILDANVEKEFKQINDSYFNTLKKYVPTNKRGNFYNIGQDVLRNHMMAHFNFNFNSPGISETDYNETIKAVIYNTFYCDIVDGFPAALEETAREFYTLLRKYITAVVDREKPGMVGLSVYSGTLAASLFTFKTIKENFPYIKTVMGGGVFASDLAVDSENFKYFLEKTPYIDKIIAGEGELLLLKLLRGELPRQQRVHTIKDISGRVLDIASDAASTPDFSDIDLDYYPYLAAYTSRSCPFNCSFCSETILWGNYRKKTARQVAAELTEMHEKYGYQLFLMSDSLLNPIAADMAKVLVKKGCSFYWDGYLRVDQQVCSRETTLLWRKGGFYRARLGLESGSQKILDMMHKRITLQQVREAVTSLAHAGIKTTTMWVIGHPGETEQDFQQTLDLVEELKDDIYEADCNPLWYFPTGQVDSNAWDKKYNRVLLYPAKAKELLIAQTWAIASEPSREETFERLNRFVQHCKNLGIPNPYSLEEIFHADERWKKLHKLAVPLLLDFNNKNPGVDENTRIEELIFAPNPLPEEEDFEF